MFAYTPSASHITGAWDQSSLNVEFDTAVVGGDEIVAVGKAANDSVSLFGLDGVATQAALTTPDDAPGTVSQFGISVEFVGDKLAVSAFDSANGGVVYVFEPDVNGVYDNDPEAVLSNINIGSSIPMAEFGNQLLVRTADAVNVYNLGSGGSLDHAILVATNAPNNDAIATNGDNIVVTSDVGGDTQVLEFDGDSGAQVRNFTFGAGSGGLALTLAMSDSGDVFIGNVSGVPDPDTEILTPIAVYQFDDATSTPGPVTVAAANTLHTYSAEGTDFTSPQSLTVSGDELLVGFYIDGDSASTFSTVYDTTTGAKKQELTVPEAAGTFGLTARPLTNGYAISDLAGDNEGRIYFFTEASPSNQNPTANPSPATQSAVRYQTVSFTGAGTDVDGTIVAYAWDFDYTGTFAADVATQNASTSFSTTGLHTVALQVTDNAGGVGIATVTVNVTASAVVGGTLVVGGTNGTDTVLISGNTVTINGVSQAFTGGKVVVYGGPGADIIGVTGGTKALEAHGGDGNDILSGGNGADILVGDGGNDIIAGNGGRDLLIGGQGADLVAGLAQDDILIAGSTKHDNNSTALGNILAVWTSSGSYSARVATLVAPSGALTPDTDVFDDNAVDILTGNAGTDWFLFNNDGPNAHDLVLDASNAEVQSDLDVLPV